MSKLFEVPAKKRNVVFYLETYKTNRVLIKIMSFLKESKYFTVESVGGVLDSRIFEISIFSDVDADALGALLKEEIIDIMRDKTPDNYLFSFKAGRLGFVNSFIVYSDNGFSFEICHKIKEVKKNTTIPVNKITLK